MSEKLVERNHESAASTQELLDAINKAEAEKLISKQHAKIYRQTVSKEISLKVANERINRLEVHQLSRTQLFIQGFKEAVERRNEAIKAKASDERQERLKAQLTLMLKAAQSEGIVNPKEAEITQNKIDGKITAEQMREQQKDLSASIAAQKDEFQCKLGMENDSFVLKTMSNEPNIDDYLTSEDVNETLKELKTLSEKTSYEDRLSNDRDNGDPKPPSGDEGHSNKGPSIF